MKRAGIQPDGLAGDAVISSLETDSRKVQPGALFICMEGHNRDSHEFIGDAVSRGAAALLVHSASGAARAAELKAPYALVTSEGVRFMDAVAKLAHAFYGNPSKAMRVTGVTGTNGKTTTSWMMRDALNALGKRCAYLGTLGFHSSGSRRTLENTTPFPVEFATLLGEASRDGMTDVVLEASSHGLLEHRLWGTRFACGVFTNMSQDHLDYHITMQDYEAAKLLLFTKYADAGESAFSGAINVDDPVGARWMTALSAKVSEGSYRLTSYGRESGDLRARSLHVSASSIQIRWTYRGAESETHAAVGGTFNVSNLLSACGGLLALGYSLDDAARGLAHVTSVPGRFEAVPTNLGFDVIVDYAHTPDALEKLIQSARELRPKRILCVFGCGGDRDKTKRPKMAAVVSNQADVAVVTSDNPRTEDPESIIRDILAGLKPGARSITEIDRPTAVRRAVELAEEGDIVLIAGKGHEDYQIIGRTKHPMDDRQLAKDALADRRVRI